MKKHVLIILIVSFFLISKSRAENKLFLWKFKSNKTTVYLFGSVHVGTQSMYPLDDRIMRAFKRANHVVFEVNMKKINYTKIRKLTFQLGTYKNNDTIANHISRELYLKVKKHLSKFGVNINAFKNYKPWLLALVISMMSSSRVGYNQRLGIEYHLLGKIKNNQKVLGLETSEEQLRLFANLPKKISIAFLKHSLVKNNDYVNGINKIVQFWKTGNTKALAEIIHSSFKKHPEFMPVYQSFFVNRNRKMAKKIINFIKTKNNVYFVVVGAGHLVGKESVISILKKKGYNFKQL